jgi:hypothetical protein
MSLDIGTRTLFPDRKNPAPQMPSHPMEQAEAVPVSSAIAKAAFSINHCFSAENQGRGASIVFCASDAEENDFCSSAVCCK